MAMKRPPVRLRIQRLVLDGVPVADPTAFAQALKAQIEHLLSEHGMPPDATSAGRLHTDPVRWGETAPDALGARVAGAVYKSIGGQKS